MHHSSGGFADGESKLIELIGKRTGLQVRAKDRAGVLKALQERCKARRAHGFEEYRALLEGPDSQAEWNALLPDLTNGESYFLRDEGQIELLRSHLLPELIHRHERDKTLRLWSAGCSTGEEPYSFAMLLDALLPSRNGWNISILGTDINEAALTRARRAIYGEWAFRGMNEEMRRRYFRPVAGGYEFSPKLRQMVSFAFYNLRAEGPDTRPTPPQSKLQDMDLIVCRNVLIYLRPEAVGHALSQFTQSLRAGGYLLTGHAELAHHDPSPLQARVLPGSIAYQRPLAPPKPALVAPPKTVPPLPKAAPRLKITTVPNEIKPAKPAPDAVPAAKPIAGAELCRQAREHADSGRYDAAIGCCIAATEAEPTFAEAYFVWAQVAQEQKQPDEAKRLFKKVIYLAPEHIEAYLELGALYASATDATRARRMRQTALELLRVLPASAPLPSGANRAELIEHVEQLLASSAVSTRVAAAKTRGAR